MDSLSAADWVVIAILAVSFFSGLAQGFFRSVCGLAGLILGLAVASWNYHAFADAISSFIPERNVDEIIGFIVLAVAVIVVISGFGHLMAKSFKLVGLGWLDSIAGGAFGLIQGAFIITIIIFILIAFAPQQARWMADGRLPREFFSVTQLGSHITPADMGVRIRQGLADLEKRTPGFLHPNQ